MLVDALRTLGNSSDAWDKTGFKAKFIPTSTKPTGWSGAWFDLEQYPKKLQEQDQSTLSRQGRCWESHGCGHRGSNGCCSESTNRLNFGRVKEKVGPCMSSSNHGRELDALLCRL